MFLCRKNNLVFARFSILAECPEIFHGIFTRSPGPAAQGTSLDIGENSDRERTEVKSARKSVSECVGASELVFLNQVHGTGICVIDKQNPGKAGEQKPPPADALISQNAGTGLVIQTADCQSVMLYDPAKNAVANIHSGWRGSIANIIGKCVKAMHENFGTDPSDLKAGIGPSLGPCCSEFVNYEGEIPESFWKYKDEKNRFNFWLASIDQLREAGVNKKNIELSDICTKCNPNLFFSYRCKGDTGRFASVMGLKEKQT